MLCTCSAALAGSAGHAAEPGHAPPGDGGHGGHDVVAETFAFQEVEMSSTAKNAVKSIVLLLLVFVFLQLTEIASAVEGTKAEQEKQLEHYGIFLMLVLLVLGMISGYVLEELHINVVAEAGGVLMVGLIAGWLIVEDEETGVAMDSSGELEHVTKFDVNFFFLMLLPPIILDAGFNMDEMQRRKLFQNIGGVCACAFGGTLISTVLIALTMYAAGEAAQVVEEPSNPVDIKNDDMSSSVGFTLTESLIFGSLISATDPVTVLAIFGKMGADRDLYSLVFGESVLNDAVAIVLYKTVSAFNPNTCDLTGETASLTDGRDMSFPAPGMPACAAGFSSVVSAVGMFLKIFSGSLGVGCLMAATASLVFKHLDLTHEEFFPMENVFLFAFPYMAWMLAESLELSGIVAILFCGFGMDVYAFINLSEATQEMIKKMVKVMAFGCETFVFVYMGMALSLFEQAWFTMPAVAISIISMLYSRALNVYPICALVNAKRPARRAVKPAIQHVVWYSGLRGGIAFALGLAALTDFSCRVPTCLCILETDHATGETVCSEDVYDPWKEIGLPESLQEKADAKGGKTDGGKYMCGQYLFDEGTEGTEGFWDGVEEPRGETCIVDRDWRGQDKDDRQVTCGNLQGEVTEEDCAIDGAIEACCLTSCGEPVLETILSMEEAKEYCKCQKCEVWVTDDGERTDTCKEFVACLNTEGEGKEACDCPAGYAGAGQGILTITLICVIFCVMVLGGGAYHVMSHFGVIGIDKARADRIQKLEEQEDFMIMMAERKKSKFLNLDAQVITPFLTWQVSYAIAI